MAIRYLLSALLQTCFLIQGSHAQAISLDISNTDSLKSASRVLAESCMNFYDGDKPGGIPGLLPPSAAGSYNWWEAGALFGQMVEYYHYTGDSTWNDVTQEALLFQVGPNDNFEPTNQTRTEGNDDQAFWAFAALSAAELKFPDPPADQPQWLALAQAVFNRQAERWDDANCNGGLRWQFNPLNNGWSNKNTISNGCFFQLAARLARYTKNSTYADWAQKSYDWLWQSQLINQQTWEVYDSYNFNEQTGECPYGGVGLIQWSYNIGTMIMGSAFMYNYTGGDPAWKNRLDGFLGNTQKVFFLPEYGGNIMTEYACEGNGNCNKDQRSFKAYLSRWLALTMQVAPYTTPTIMPWLQGSAQAAVKQCVAGPGDAPGGPVACGRKWYAPSDDGERDVGNQMTVMAIVQANLIMGVSDLANSDTGTSQGNAAAGSGEPAPITGAERLATREFTTADRAGAWIVTIIALLATFGLLFFLLKDDVEDGVDKLRERGILPVASSGRMWHGNEKRSSASSSHGHRHHRRRHSHHDSTAHQDRHSNHNPIEAEFNHEREHRHRHHRRRRLHHRVQEVDF